MPVVNRYKMMSKIGGLQPIGTLNAVLRVPAWVIRRSRIRFPPGPATFCRGD